MSEQVSERVRTAVGRHGSTSGGCFHGDTDVVTGDPPSLLSIGPIPEHTVM